MALEKWATNSESNEVVESSRKELQELKTVVIANEGKDKLSLKEEDWKIKIDKRTMLFEWLFLQDGNWNEKKIAKINNFYVKKTKDWLEVYSNGEQLPRLKLNNNWTVEWRSNPNDNKFDIKLDWYWTIFESLKVELTNNYDKYRTPEKKMDFVWRGFSIEQWGKKFSVNAGNIYISWLKLYNSQTKKWENVQNITNMYVKRDNENNLTIYSSGEDKPKMLLKPNGIVKWVLPSNWDNLNYWAKEDTALWRTIWGELNSKYNTYRHEDVASTSEPVLITYTTKEEPKYVSGPIVADGNWNADIKFHRNSNGEYISGPIVADGGWNTSRQLASPEWIPSNIEWKSVVPTIKYDNVSMLDEDLVRDYGLLESLQTKKQLNVNKIWKVWKEIYINQQFKVAPKRNNRWEKYYTIWQNIWWRYHEMDSSELSSGSYRWTIYEDLNKRYFS